MQLTAQRKPNRSFTWCVQAYAHTHLHTCACTTVAERRPVTIKRHLTKSIIKLYWSMHLNSFLNSFDTRILFVKLLGSMIAVYLECLLNTPFWHYLWMMRWAYIPTVRNKFPEAVKNLNPEHLLRFSSYSRAYKPIRAFNHWFKQAHSSALKLCCSPGYACINIVSRMPLACRLIQRSAKLQWSCFKHT